MSSIWTALVQCVMMASAANRLYGNYACRNGTVLLEEPFDKNDDWEASQSALRRLLRFLGIETDYFEPLTRGYFARTRTSIFANSGEDLFAPMVCSAC